MAAAARGVTSGFYVAVTGQIDACQMSGYDNLYVKYSFNKGHDWSVLAGVEHGVSQIAKHSSGGPSDNLVWNYPLDIMFRACNVHGWPQLVLGVYGLTAFGGDVVRGYASVHVPTHPGRHTRYVQLYTPVSSSWCQRLTSWLTNNPPEFFDAKFVAQGKGREVTRVRSHGVVKLTFHVVTKNMSEWGYLTDGERPTGQGDLQAQGGVPMHMLMQQNPQLHAQGSYSESGPGLSRPPSAGGANLSARGGGGGQQQQAQQASSQVPPRTQLSAATEASLAASRGASRRNLLAGGGSDEDEFEQKYPSGGAGGGAGFERQASTLSQRNVGGPSGSPGLQPLQGGALPPLRTGPSTRQLAPM